MKCIAGLLLVVFCTSCNGQSQPNPPRNKTSRHRSGIPESQLQEAANSPVPMSMVRSVRQARNGDILIASYVGVYRYDPSASLRTGGESFTNITRSIQWPTFWDVLEDRSGNLWFASQDSGVYYLPAEQVSLPASRKDFQLFTTKDGLADNSALHIYEERSGKIWFGPDRYDPATKTFRNFTTRDGFPTNNLRLLFEDSNGKLWFGAQGEDLFVYDGKTFTVLKDKDGKTFNNVWSVIEDKKGNIWFGANGLTRYDPSTGVFTRVSERIVYAIIQDKEGNIWTTGGGTIRDVWALTRYDAKTLYDKEPTITEIMSGAPALLDLMEADDGSIWFGGLGSQTGVHRYDPSASRRTGSVVITNFKNEAGQK